MLDRVEQPSGYACAIVDNKVVAVGRAVADTGRAGLFGMATLASARDKVDLPPINVQIDLLRQADLHMIADAAVAGRP
jgi:hypothetical protein